MPDRRSESAADLSQGTPLASMSHELRAPLHAILGFAELLYDGKVGPLSADQKECLADILTSARQLRELIDAVVDGATLDADAHRK